LQHLSLISRKQSICPDRREFFQAPVAGRGWHGVKIFVDSIFANCFFGARGDSFRVMLLNECDLMIESATVFGYRIGAKFYDVH